LCISFAFFFFQLYYDNKTKQRESSTNKTYDDENSDYIIKPGEEIIGRYVVQERIGRGSFGQVVRAFDKVTSNDVALKMIKSKKLFKNQANTEIDILVELRDADSKDDNHIVRLLNHFEHRNHPCLVFELLSSNLYDLLKNTKFRGISLDLIHKFSRQILEALVFMRKQSVIHCDLKPENILLCQRKRSAIKIIDFGSSCKVDKKVRNLTFDCISILCS
jgi:dual specificity tyrosine-phosphorylation-regulated kinase 1